MSNTKSTKKKLSVSIDRSNFDKIQRIIKDNKTETTSSIINTALDMSLEEVRELLKNPLLLEEEKLKRKLEDIQRLKEREGKKKLNHN